MNRSKAFVLVVLIALLAACQSPPRPASSQGAEDATTRQALRNAVLPEICSRLTGSTPAGPAETANLYDGLFYGMAFGTTQAAM